ncbi:MAG: DUF2288 family protein [Gomphosphaeria aponina SAG 52.96 = DSM 107014]|uniref:DUF2288 family protein n=1 Tax=Gomphosphaeria aponina SAG 52.96 = DSM 107014 TaxID=1521640 RepID=A0A941GY14_9CHRO|nr:DUF2288 family protein [Gomphosphaeria aponina SAG 52.96 = DSM 107014]
MSDSIKTQLIEELADSQWSDIAPHAKRDGVIVVNESLDLVEVGMAIASNNVQLVQRWISEDFIHKPSAEELSHWNQTPDKKFSTLIVQPFVLVSCH